MCLGAVGNHWLLGNPRRIALLELVCLPIEVGEPSVLSRLSTPARQNYIAARADLGDGAWMRRDLEGALSCQHSEASERTQEWKNAGLVVAVRDPK